MLLMELQSNKSFNTIKLCFSVIHYTGFEAAATNIFIKLLKLVNINLPCGCGLEYLLRCPASHRRRRKGNPEPGPPGWDLDARLTTLFCNKIIVAKSKEVKSGWSNSLQE
jgi:hypothetical protein